MGRLRPHLALTVLPLLVATSCGRLGYEEIPGVGAGAVDSGDGGGAGAGAGADAGAGAGAGADAGAASASDSVSASDSSSASDSATLSDADADADADSAAANLSVGCADGHREGFGDLATYPDIAACAGGFSLPGVVGLGGPACALGAGNNGANPSGTGCNAMDLCAAGFHLCADDTEVAAKSPTGCVGATSGATSLFFVTAQHGAGQAQCGTTGTNDIFGCGSLGATPNANCAPLDRWSGNRCVNLAAPWSCGTTGMLYEGSDVVKPGPDSGGVLCCRN